MKNKVIIKSITSPRRYNSDSESVEVFVDGESLGIENYGGEPEDNSRGRDYGWVEPLLKQLAEKLGAEVEVMEITESQQ